MSSPSINISELTKRTIQHITKNGEAITPIIFFDTFCGEARRNRASVEDCEVIKNYIDKLDQEFRNEALRYNIRTIKEFLSYLTSALNRMNGNHLATRHNSLLELSKKMVEVASQIDNNDLQNLSGRTNGVLDRVHTSENLDDLKREWAKFSLSYKKDRNREKLAKFIKIDKEDDLDSIIDKVVPILEESQNSGSRGEETSKIVNLLFNSLSPSLVALENREVEMLYKKLRSNPDLIFDEDTQKTIEKLHDDRVERDRQEERASISKAKNIISSLVDEEPEKDLGKFDTSSDIDNLRDEVQKITDGDEKIGSEEKRSIFSSFGEKISKIKEETSSLFGSLKKYSEKMFEAKEKLSKLESDIKNLRSEANRDLLTKMKNRKGFEDDLNAIEKEFSETKANYSVIVIDIDNFRETVRKFGNDAGDLILRYFSKILKEYISVGDSTARYGEDRFIVSLPNRDLKDAVDFANRFREKVQHTKFMYKNERVSITFSAGVSDRLNSEKFEDLLDKSLQMVKEAKSLGKNCIYPN